MALLEYKCPNCGGAIRFDPGTQELTCPYCASVMNIEALRAAEEALRQKPESDIDWGYEGSEWQEGERQGMAAYVCKSCGGEIIGDETMGATSCPFCGNPVVISSKFAGMLKPDVVIPFKLGKKDALQALEKHYLGKKLLPKVFKDRNHLDEVKGVYVPFWLFNAEADVSCEYEGTKIRHWSDSNYNYTETSVFRIYREGNIGFNEVPVDGSKAIDDTLMESIEPYHMEDATDFQTAFLAGYLANKYDVDSSQSILRANERIKNSSQAAFASTVTGYASVTPRYADIRLKSGGVRYALLPVWLLSTSFEGKNFIFAMNGQTGKFAGDLPLDKAAYKSWFLKIFGIAAAALLVISQIVASLM
ncbi:MAG: DNA-directed RNA polymerase subunit P [Firmicutes bacterium ADurb.Bin182]|nr:MAG: DNA-directed RNA polymerase subunit P [Firmicutes bacterium ADurb.Bin182]